MGILCLRRLHRHCKVVLTCVLGVVILQTGSSLFFCVGIVSLSIAALCHAKNGIGNMVQGHYHIGMGTGEAQQVRWNFEDLKECININQWKQNNILDVSGASYTRHGKYCIQRSYIHLGSYYTSTFKARRNLLLIVTHEYM